MTERRPRSAAKGRAKKRSPDGEEAQGPFRIRAVAHLTGVPEPTLRAWERRYGIPSPERTTSGYRLYTAEEVRQVREMRGLCSQGMAAAEAAKLLREGKSGAPAVVPAGSDPYAASLARIVEAVAAFDDVALEHELRRLLFLGSATTILDRVLTPALHEIGRRYHEGALSIAQEHLASQHLGTLLRDLLRLSRGADSESRVLLACFADEEHELGLLGVATLFAGWGVRPVFLGARTPPEALRSAVLAMTPVMVALSATVAPEPVRARELVLGYAEACGRTPWMVGGAAVPHFADLVRASGGEVAPGDPLQVRALVQAAVKGATSGRRRARN